VISSVGKLQFSALSIFNPQNRC